MNQVGALFNVIQYEIIFVLIQFNHKESIYYKKKLIWKSLNSNIFKTPWHNFFREFKPVPVQGIPRM